MSPLDVIRFRRSVRKFTSAEVRDDELASLLDAAKWAPSAGNLQAADIIVVRDKETKDALSEAALGQRFVSEAPIVLVACANAERSSRRYGSRGRSLYCLMDAAAAVQNILLAAHSIGLATCWVGAFDEEAVKNILKIPEGARPVALIPVGYPAEQPAAPPRRLHLHEGRW